MSTTLVIVESPAKARTIARYLGAGYRVESSIGHIRDLPSRAADIPAKFKKESWARLGVNVDSGFEALYIVPPEKRAQVNKLKALVADADAVYLATDEDREGEAIAWHLREVLRPKGPVRRMVFSEITKSAIQKALEKTREIDERLVDAQEARRVLDRLYGYEVSPVLWKKVKPKLSAGRVQSVATRLIVERERSRMRFVAASYWDVEAELQHGEDRFSAKLVEVSGQRLASGRDFDAATGEVVVGKGVLVLGEPRAKEIAKALGGCDLEVAAVQEKPFVRRPYPPFITSTLQQEAGRKLRLGAQRTMRIAQGLYENGYITYMRTDSTTLSQQAIEAARSQIASRYGAEYLPAEPRFYKSSSKNAQEAHEAIRPAGDAFRTPSDLAGELDLDSLRLYELIWKRTVACQMKDANGLQTAVRLSGDAAGDQAVFTASGRVLQFAGFLRAYVEGSDDPQAELEDQEKLLPALTVGDRVKIVDLEAAGHTTEPPARYTEASLVKELEQRGIGRPSTYASILQTIQDRGYVWRKGTALVPTFTAFAVTGLLEKHLTGLVDFEFTARMEGDLDAIARGEQQSKPWLAEFYFGGGKGRGLRDQVSAGVDEIDARVACSLPLGEDEQGRVVAVRVGRYGAYLQLGDGDQRVSLPEESLPDELTLARALELLAGAKQSDEPLGDDPQSGLPVYAKTGRYGDYVQLGVPELDDAGKVKRGGKPRMASLWPTMKRDELTLDQALVLLSFPKVVGKHPESGVEIIAQDGRFGPYIKCGEETRSLPNHEALAAVDLERALELLSQPKATRRGAAALIAELGVHPESAKPVVVKSGRYGPYVTDGIVNATIPKDQDPAALSLEEAVGLLAERARKVAETGGAPARRPRRKKKT